MWRNKSTGRGGIPGQSKGRVKMKLNESQKREIVMLLDWIEATANDALAYEFSAHDSYGHNKELYEANCQAAAEQRQETKKYRNKLIEVIESL